MSIFNFKVCSVVVILVLLMLFLKKTGNKTRFCFVLNNSREFRKSQSMFTKQLGLCCFCKANKVYFLHEIQNRK